MEQAFSEAIPGIFDFIRQAASDKDIEMNTSIAGMLGDLADVMGVSI